MDDPFVQKLEGKRRKKESTEKETKAHKHPISAKHIRGEGRSKMFLESFFRLIAWYAACVSVKKHERKVLTDYIYWNIKLGYTFQNIWRE